MDDISKKSVIINSNIPVAQKELTIKQSKRKGGVVKRLVVIVLFALAGLILLLNAYLYFFHVNRIIEKEESIVEVKDSSITKEEAEAKNLESVNKQPKSIETLTESSVLTAQASKPYSTTEINSIHNLEIDVDGQIIDKNLNDKGYVNIFYITQDTRSSLKVDANNIAKNIVDYVKLNKLVKIELDVSLTYLPDYFNLVSQIRLGLLETKLGIYLYPKWGNEVDYTNYATISNNFHREMNLNELENLVDEIKIMAFDYTGPLDILPGPITPKQWFESIIQYYISEGVEREKIIVGINASVYRWPEREFAHTPVLNYSTLQLEADIINRADFETFIDSANLIPEEDNIIEEEVYKFIQNNTKYIALKSSDFQISQFKKIAAEYGMQGIYYK